MSETPFFEVNQNRFHPTPVCAGPWNPDSLHGRVVAGLLAFEIERHHTDAELQPARLTVDLYRLPDFSPIELQSHRVRDGRRIRVVDAECFSNGRSVGRASCQLLRRSQSPPNEIWQRGNWDAPKPAELAAPDAAPMGGMWITRPIPTGESEPRRIWMREVRELVFGHALTPWQRVALAADFTSPFANSGTTGLGFINTDITLYLHRAPTTEWIGFEVANHESSDGVAIAECYLHDEDGAIGSSSVTALAQKPLNYPKPPS